jgi:hypothetical protein
MTTPAAWFQHPKTGAEQADARAVMAAMEMLDGVRACAMTDALRLLAARYADDLRRMVEEDRAAMLTPTAAAEGG